MTRLRLFACCLVALAIGCKKDATFSEPLPDYAHITFLNAVSDTGQLDVRVIDLPTNGSFMDVDFRSAFPFPQPLEPGQHRIKVFLSRTDSLTSRFLLDTTFDFAGGQPYFVYLRGQTRAGTFGATIASLAPPTVPAGQFAIRFLNLAPSTAGAARGVPDTTAAPDIYITARNARPGGTITPAVAGLAYGQVSPYVFVDTAAFYRIQVLAPGLTDPAIVQARVPPGDTAAAGGTPPIAGSRIPGSVFTAVITPRSNPDPANPVLHSRPTAQATDTSVSEAATRTTRSGDTVTVQVGSITNLVNRRSASGTARADSTIARTGTGGATSATAGQVILVSGATQPEYNGWQEVLAIADTLICKPGRAGDVVTGNNKRCKAPADTTVLNADTARTVFRFRYRIVGAPVSPATGSPVYRLYPPNYVAPDFATPQVNFMVDKRP